MLNTLTEPSDYPRQAVRGRRVSTAPCATPDRFAERARQPGVILRARAAPSGILDGRCEYDHPPRARRRIARGWHYWESRHGPRHGSRDDMRRARFRTRATCRENFSAIAPVARPVHLAHASRTDEGGLRKCQHGHPRARHRCDIIPNVRAGGRSTPCAWRRRLPPQSRSNACCWPGSGFDSRKHLRVS